MTPNDTSRRVAHHHNPQAAAENPYLDRHRAIISRRRFDDARREMVRWPGYEPTPLVTLAGLAAELGIRTLWYKDESGRFGLSSFKALGGAYAVFRQVVEIASNRLRRPVHAADLVAGDARDTIGDITVTCATDGNHGRSVAWGARTFGCKCVVFVHEGVSGARVAAIERYGATVRRVSGTYDDSVQFAAEEARARDWIVIADTSYPGYSDIPKDVMQGYTLMADEVLRQLPAATLPTHAFVQSGVGGLAAAVCGHFWETLGPRRPRLIVVEPDRSACLLASARAGRPTKVRGRLETVMAGLACGAPSRIAWDILADGADDFITIPDRVVAPVMRLLAEGVGGDPPIVAGESAVAGLAALIRVLAQPDLAAALGLAPDSRVLVLGTEGATDPDLYERMVGRTADAVADSRMTSG
ncbi:MAG: diaminopropionate ammonia-lyase [Rhodospirillaceae bacterium]|nr:diaminopropionate ammonia-lyase [Rhodospirillaceae bacterium]